MFYPYKMKSSTNKKQSIKQKITGKNDRRDHHFNKAIPPTTHSMETLPTLSNLAAVKK